MTKGQNFEMTASGVGAISSKRLRISGTVRGDRLYRGDIVEIDTPNGKFTACVQSIRDGRRRLTSADPGEEVSLILPGLKKEYVCEGSVITRSKLGNHRYADFDEEIELPVDVMKLKKARRRYVYLSAENRLLLPIKITVVAVCLLFTVFAVRRVFGFVYSNPDQTGILTALGVLLCIVVPAIALMGISLTACRTMVMRHVCFDNTPLKIKNDRIELVYRKGASVYRSEVFFGDIDSIEYYPRYGSVRVNAPVRLAKIKNGEIIGTKFERSEEKGFQVYFLIYMDNDLFMRSLTERSGVPVETFETEKPDVDCAKY
ncbi:MAG: hypothetical protein IKZ19_07860 [Clostridia bacterium]|nr:hypothetical protein [Clostridia bacterium]